ncbi:ribosome silencing factor [Oceanidesulfovibrio marinus]|uniref:ribosome silencing factor n=1 Tax=Oceanidesulfovibrio marinus TaxID=370038 RepID=UPI001F389C19|nr:ribosome silencing factor [Oceanidesulfovibrio marinus]
MALILPDKKFSQIPTAEKVRLVAAKLHEKQGREIVALDLSRQPTPTEAAVLVTGTSARHAKALADAVLDMCREQNIEYLGMEGYKGGLWILMDLNDILVHIFQGEGRSLFNLEGLWAGAGRLDTGVAAEEVPASDDDFEDEEE